MLNEVKPMPLLLAEEDVAGMNVVAHPVTQSKVLRQQSPVMQKHLVSDYLDMLLEDYFKVGISPETYSLYQNHCMHVSVK